MQFFAARAFLIPFIIGLLAVPMLSVVENVFPNYSALKNHSLLPEILVYVGVILSCIGVSVVRKEYKTAERLLLGGLLGGLVCFLTFLGLLVFVCSRGDCV